MGKKVKGLLVMAYGTPTKEEEVEPYYTHIRQGSKPEPEVLQELISRYKLSGDVSSFAKITEEQAKSLCEKLNELQDDVEYKVYVGLKHMNPFIEDAVEQMANDGVTEAISIVLSPHYSTYSTKSYNERAATKAEKHGIELTSIKDWYNERGFIKFWANGIKDIYDDMTTEEQEHTVVIYSAQSLPDKILEAGDPYPLQLEETADLISDATGITEYDVGWQSEGDSREQWMGPDVQDLTRILYHEKGYQSFIYVPVGFVAEQLEVLYDNDYECKAVCDELGANYYRPEMPNVNPLFIETLAKVVLKKE